MINLNPSNITKCEYVSDKSSRLKNSWEKMFRKYAANLQENTHAEV